MGDFFWGKPFLSKNITKFGYLLFYSTFVE